MESHTDSRNWTWSEKLTFQFLFIFVLSFICSFSFPHNIIPDPGRYVSPYSGKAARWFLENVLRLPAPHGTQLYSDTTVMYADALMLLSFAGICTPVWSFFDRKRHNYSKLFYWFRVVVGYYLGMQLIVYGADKIFKTQFYLPEPNILYTALGNVPRDLLYWSAMGVSRTYCIFTGCAELLCSALLLFNRTRRVGAWLSVLILANVVMINISFDISVKLYSSFLLLLAIILAVPYIAIRYCAGSSLWRPKYNTAPFSLLHATGKAMVIIIIVADTLWGYAAARNFNDDAVPRPFLHGAYHVEQFVRNTAILPPLETDTTRWRRVFVHRRGYFIAQYMNDEMQDYLLSYDTAHKYLMISDMHDLPVGMFQYAVPDDSSLVLSGNIGNDSVWIMLQKLHTDKLRLFEKGHLTVDE